MTPFRQILRLCVAASIGLWLLSWGQWHEGYWLLLTALFSLQIGGSGHFRHTILLLTVTAVCTTMMVTITNALASHVVWLALFLGLTTLATVTLSWRYRRFWGAAVLVNFLGVLSAGLPTDHAGGDDRALFVLAGFALAAVLQATFFPNRWRADIRWAFIHALQHLMDLNQAIFNCLIASNYPDNPFEYNKAVHQERRNFSTAIVLVRTLINKISQEKACFVTMLSRIELLYEQLQAVGLLVYRVEDHTTFQIIGKELLTLSETIYQDLRNLKLFLLNKTQQLPTHDRLQETLYQLDDVNHSALVVAAKDPMVFLLFIQDLTALAQTMQSLGQAVKMVNVIC